MHRTRSLRRIALVAVVPFLLASAPSAARAQAIFTGSTVTIGGGTDPEGIASGDVNGDGNLDLVTANYGTDNFTVLLGNGSGGFAATLVGFANPFGTQPGSFILMDANGDHVLDLIAPAFFNPAFGKLLGTGTGAFGAPTGINLLNAVTGSLSADLNGDDHNDLIGSGYNSDSFEVALGTGTGGFTFAASVAFPAPFGTNLGPFAVADFDQNGVLDVVSATYYAAGFGVALGDGTGNFPTLLATTAGTTTEGVAVGDFDADGLPDVAVLDTAGKRAFVYRNMGGALFAPSTTLTTGTGPFGIAFGDVSGDGLPDLLVSETGADVMRVFVGLGGGSFTAGTTVATGANPLAFVLGYFNGDGHLHAATANSGSNNVTFLKNAVPNATGVASFGGGTGGCSARLGIATTEQALVGDANFAVVCTNAPRSTIGLCMLASAQDVAGSDPFAFGFLLHVDPFTIYDAVNFGSDAQGSGIARIPLPNIPGLAGVTTYAQGLWVEAPFAEACSAAFAGAVTTKGLAVTVF